MIDVSQIPVELLEDKVTLNTLRVYDYLLEFSQNGLVPVVNTNQQIADDLKVDLFVVKRALSYLRDKELISSILIQNKERILKIKRCKNAPTQNVINQAVSNMVQNCTTAPILYIYTYYYYLLLDLYNVYIDLYNCKERANNSENLKKNNKKKEIEYPSSYEEIIPLVNDYLEKHKDNENLKNANANYIALSFFTYWDSANWTRANRCKIKSIEGTLARWIVNSISYGTICPKNANKRKIGPRTIQDTYNDAMQSAERITQSIFGESTENKENEVELNNLYTDNENNLKNMCTQNNNRDTLYTQNVKTILLPCNTEID